MNFILRHLKNGELTLLNLTLLVTIFSLSTILFFTEGLRVTLFDKTGTLLGGDRVIRSPTPLDPSFKAQAEALNLQTANTMTFLSMLVYQDTLALAEIKAVDEHYPLKGSLQGTLTLFGPEQDFHDIPEPGTVWLETNLFTLLGVKINDVIKIGEAHFRVARVLTFEPDRGGQGLAFAPRALMNLQDVDKTKVIQQGSRQTYQLGVIGNSEELDKFDAIVVQKYSPLKTTKWLVLSNLS